MYVLLAVSVIANLAGTMMKKIWGNQYPDRPAMGHLYNAVISLVSALFIWILTGLKLPQISPFTLLLGIVFGVVTAVQVIFNLKALEKGKLSYTTVVVSLSTVIPTVSGALFWNERIFPVQIVGAFLMVVCFLCFAENKKSDKKTSLLWFLYVGITFITTGLIGVLQKWHQSTAYSNELDGFLILAFLISFVYSTIFFVLSMIRQPKADVEKRKCSNKELAFIVLLMTISGICVAANNKINLYLSGVMDSVVFFPTVNGGGLILTTIASLIFFKEKPAVKQWIGIVIGIAAVILLCNPF